MYSQITSFLMLKMRPTITTWVPDFRQLYVNRVLLPLTMYRLKHPLLMKLMRGGLKSRYTFTGIQQDLFFAVIYWTLRLLLETPLFSWQRCWGAVGWFWPQECGAELRAGAIRCEHDGAGRVCASLFPPTHPLRAPAFTVLPACSHIPNKTHVFIRWLPLPLCFVRFHL